MADSKQIIELYSALADTPEKDFGWDKGLENAKAHGYKDQWFEALPSQIWQYCAAVGNPFSLGEIARGSTVVDLGCGAGVDLLVAAYLVGKEGKAIGVDITPKMVQKSKEHALLAGFENVEVLESSFDKVDLEDDSVDYVISNGAINLTSCKESVFAEIYRILKPEGKIYFADMIDVSSENACSLENSACCDNEKEDWANCVAGTLRQDKLIGLMQDAGFKEVECTALTHYTTAETTQGATFKARKMSSFDKRALHWNSIYQKADYTQVLWHQSSPQKSLELIQKYSAENAAIIDVGCGASLLVDELLKNNYTNISLLDSSKSSLEIVKKRLDGQHVQYLNEDILRFQSDKKFTLWHDRAVFHFLCTPKEQERYFEVLLKVLDKEGIAIISTFKTQGPSSCAGLNIEQYDPEKLKNVLPKSLELLEYEDYKHITPKASEQAYIYFVIKKRD